MKHLKNIIYCLLGGAIIGTIGYLLLPDSISWVFIFVCSTIWGIYLGHRTVSLSDTPPDYDDNIQLAIEIDTVLNEYEKALSEHYSYPQLKDNHLNVGICECIKFLRIDGMISETTESYINEKIKNVGITKEYPFLYPPPFYFLLDTNMTYIYKMCIVPRIKYLRDMIDEII